MNLFLLLVIGCATLASAKQCCDNGVMISARGKCGTEAMTSMNCSYGRMVLKDVVLDGTKVSTKDTPGFVFVEDPNQYCLGTMYLNSTNEALGTINVAVVCFEEIKSKSYNDVETSGILTLVSVVFLILTFAVYMYLPQLRDLQGMCYICMCISMSLGYMSLGILQLNPGFREEVCTLTGFLVYTWMMATFFWMNVICINLYRTVLDATHLKKTERTQYFWYSCYAWGGTVIFLIVALITNFVEGDHKKPGFGNGSCWFQGRTETWLFFYGPIAILITINVISFILSSLQLWAQHSRKYEVNKLNNLKYKFLLSLKLFLVMGISWIFEVASFAHGEQHIIWKIMDTFNCLQGVVIFLLLVVFRRRAIHGLAEVNCCGRMLRPFANMLNPHDDPDDQRILDDDTVEVKLNDN